jgi:hypothetical protein
MREACNGSKRLGKLEAECPQTRKSRMIGKTSLFHFATTCNNLKIGGQQFHNRQRSSFNGSIPVRRDMQQSQD